MSRETGASAPDVRSCWNRVDSQVTIKTDSSPVTMETKASLNCLSGVAVGKMRAWSFAHVALRSAQSTTVTSHERYGVSSHRQLDRFLYFPQINKGNIKTPHQWSFYGYPVVTCGFPIQLGWGLLSQFSPFRYFPHFPLLSKQTLAIEYHVYIWQVSAQLSCGDNCQIWMWFRESNRYFCKIENFAYGEISIRSFSNPPPPGQCCGKHCDSVM